MEWSLWCFKDIEYGDWFSFSFFVFFPLVNIWSPSFWFLARHCATHVESSKLRARGIIQSWNSLLENIKINQFQNLSRITKTNSLEIGNVFTLSLQPGKTIWPHGIETMHLKHHKHCKGLETKYGEGCEHSGLKCIKEGGKSYLERAIFDASFAQI